MTYANTTPVIPGSKVITLVYSTTKKNHDIKLNVVIPPVLLDSNGEAASHPLLIAWHGGGLVNGSRLDQYISEPLLDAVAENGWILIQPDYRLLVPSNGFDLVDDVNALFEFLASPKFASALPTWIKPDLHRIAVTGFSAGSYLIRLSVMKGHVESIREEGPRFTIRSNAIYCGMGGDLLLDYWTKFSDKAGKTFAEEEIRQQKPKTLANFHSLLTQEKEISVASYTKGLEGYDAGCARGAIWDYWAYHGTIIDTLTGEPGLGARLAALPYESRLPAIVDDDEYARAIPQVFYERLKTKKPAYFPPTMLIHGNFDSEVPFSESLNTLKQLQEANLPVEMITVDGANHNFNIPGTEKPVDWDEGKVVEFLKLSLS